VTEGEETVGGRTALRVSVTGAPAHAIDGVHRYRLWLDAEDGFPLKVVSFSDDNDEPLETVTLDDIEIDVTFPERFFAP
jgi:outer membrane lipoprotein-sorting protein